ncbi:MAG: hypothetical protein ABIJ56_10560 [Pseudomonadota bacterium]
MGDSFKKQVAITVLTATVSMAAGFFLVYLLVGPAGSDGSEEIRTDEGKPTDPGKKQEAGREAEPGKKPAEAAPAKAGGGSDSRTPGAVPGAAGAGEGTKQPDKAQPDEAAKPAPEPETAPAQAKAGDGASAAGLAMKDNFIFRCWKEGDDTPVERDGCGTLAGVEGLVESRLDGIGKCVKEYGGGSGGSLSMALKIDFAKNRYRAWLGKSSSIEGVEATSACIRQLYSGVAWESMEHSFATYIVFFNIDVN